MHIFQTGAFIALYVIGSVMQQTGRWDIIYYGFAAFTTLVCIIFVCKIKINLLSYLVS